MEALLEKISKIGIVPVVVLENAEDAVPTAQALQAGGICCAEITFRTAAAEESIANITQTYPDMLVGAGTVLNCEQVDRAVSAGAKFIVTPGYNPNVVNYCIQKNIPVIPGCMDTNAIEMALEAGIDTVKFFPAEAAGGLAMLKALSGPYVNLKFMPTGGVNAENVGEYLNFSKVVACGGSWMVKPVLIREGRFEEITKLTREAIRTMLGFEVMHVGINETGEENAYNSAKCFERLFGFAAKDGNNSVFAGPSIEITKCMFPGEHGHIAIGTKDIERAVYYLTKDGAEIDMETAKYKGAKLHSVYLKNEISGFAVHLVQK